MSAYDQFLTETKSAVPTGGAPKVVPPAVGNQKQPDIAPSAPTSAFARFQQETSVAPKAPIVTPVVTATNPKNQSFLDWYDNTVVKKSNQALAPVASGLFNSLASMVNIPQDLLRYGSMAQKAVIGYALSFPEKVAKGSDALLGTGLAPNLESIKKKSDSFFDGIIDTVDKSKANPDSIPNKVTAFVQKHMDNVKRQYGVDPENQTFTQNLEEGVGSMLSFVALGGLVSKAFKLLGTAEKIATVGGETVMTLTEASQERQGTYQQVLQDTGDPAEAQKKADTTFFANVALIGITNRFSHYLDAGSKQGGGVFGLLKDSLTSSLSEGSQEGLQQVIQNYSSGRPLLEGVTDNALIGGILGSGTHLATRPFVMSHAPADLEKFRAEVIKENKDNPIVQEYANKPAGGTIEADSAYAKFAKEKGVDLTKPALELQKDLEVANAPKGSVPAQGYAPLEGVSKDNQKKISYEEATPIADKATERYWSEKIQPAVDKGEPVVIGADDLKDHFSGDYNDNNHPIYSQSAFKLFELALQKAKGDTLVLTAGGAGSGKTELVTRALIRSGFDGIIYDSNLANYDGAVKQIDLARKAGKKIEIRGVLPNLERSRTFTIQRENKVGRGISDATFARGHAGMPAVLAKLLEEGKVKESEVKLLDTRNLDTMEKAFEAIYNDEYVPNVLDTLKNIGYNEDNIKQTYAKDNYDKTTGQRAKGEVPNSEGASPAPTQDRTDKGKTERGGNGKEVPRNGEQSKKEEVKTPKKKPEAKKEETPVKKSNKKTYDTLHRIDGKNQRIQKVVSSEGKIAGFSVFTYKNDNGKYVVIDKKTGLSLSNNTYKTLKSAIENEKEYLVNKAGSEEKLKEMFKEAYKRSETLINQIDEGSAPSGGGSSFASIGRYREEGNVVAGRVDEIKPIEFPELLDLAKELSGNIPFIKKYTRANGMFYGKGTGEIGLNPELFKEGNLGQLQKTFAHEIGHLIDYLPDQTMKRGNVLARLSVLKDFNKDFYAGAGATRTDKEVRSQLWELSKYWKPIDEATASKSFLAYRKSAPEVYADFISVLFNDPNLVAVKAPTAYNVFFEQLDKKPLVKKAYFELQDFLRYGDKVAKRRSATNQMFKLTEQQSRERQIQMQQELEEKERSVWFKFKTEFVDITEAVKQDVRRAQQEGTTINPDDNPVYYLEERNYLGGKIKSEVDTKFNKIYQDLQREGMTWEDLGELMFYERILKGDRGEVANPLGYQPDFVQELMDTYEDVGTVKPDNEAHKKGTSDMKSTLGESRYIRLQELAVQYRQNLKSFFEQGREEGIYSEDLAKLFEENAFYVPFKGAKYSGVSRTTFGVKAQKGTLGDIENPANTGIEKAVSIIRAIERNRVTRKTIEFYQENFSDEITEAKRDQQGYPIPPKEEGQSLVTYMEDGKVQGFYVDSYIAEAIQKNTVAKQNQIIGAIRFFNSGLFRPLFITFNLGFQSFNLIRDFKRFWKNVPDMTIFNAMKLYGKSARASKIRAFGLPENPSPADQEAYDLINKLENDKVISITYNDIIKGENIEDAQIDRILRETGVREVQQTKLGAIGEKIGVTKETPIIKQAFQILDFIEKTGNMIETLPKVAGVMALEGKMNPIEMRSFVRKYVGSPDFLAGGRDKKSVNEILLFANAIAQGIRSDYTIATEPKSRGAYWWKTVQSELLPKALMLAVTAGLFGDWLKELFDKVSEYDKANYTIIPLGEDENGKAVYFRMPSDETGRLIGGTFWKLATAIGSPEKLAELETYTDLLTYAGGQVPSVSPVVQLGAFTIPSFVAGNNPYDFFRGRPILTDEQQLAGGSERLKPFLSYMFQQMGGNVFMKLNYNETVPKNPSLSEKIVSLPLASNIAGRFIKVSNYGETEKLRAITDDIKQENARENIANRRVVFDYVDQAQGKSYGEQQALKREMIKEIIGDKIVTKEDRQKKSTLEKRFTTLLIRGEADPQVDLLVTAQSNEEKVALLMEYKKSMSDEKFEELRRFIIKNKVVSGEAYRQFIVNSNTK